MKLYRKNVKRCLDVFFAFILIIILLPLYIMISILVAVKLGRPIIFRQKRPGKNGVIFEILKYRTMTDEKDELGQLLPDTERLTGFGRTLRSTSLDELPELFNILKGEMSFIGPRPLAVQYLPYYTDEEKRRHDVLPGLTGLAQVNGRNHTTWEKRFEYDIYYVDNLSFLLDMKIIFETFKTIFSRTGIGERGVDSPVDFDEYRRKMLEDSK